MTPSSRASRSPLASAAFPSAASPSAADIRRAALSYALAEGWKVSEHRVHMPDGVGARRPAEALVVVSGGELPGRCLLRVRERRGEDAAHDVAARRAASSEHVVGVVARLPARRFRRREWDAVLLHLADGGGLERLLLREGGLRGGEAATVLLGVAAGIAALHEHGWARPALSASGVVFAADGCPALDALDDVTPWEPDAAVADAGAFHALSRRVCLSVTDGSGMMLLAAVERGLRKGRWRAVEEAVLAVAAPEPVTLAGPGAPAAEEPAHSGTALRRPSKAGRRDAVGRGGGGSTRTSRAPAGRTGDRVATAVSAVMTFLDGDPARTVARRAGAWLRRRPAMVIVGLLPVAAALAVVGLLPASPAESVPTAPPTSRLPVASSPASASAAATGAAAKDGRPGADEGQQRDDPVVAAASVLEAWHACFTLRPIAQDCLSRVLDGEPGFLAAETQALGTVGAAEARDYAGAGLSLVERGGDAALIGVVPDAARTPHTTPASLLVVRSDGGWRLRAVFP
ncbi:hypothetical protein [Leifsonia sp. LS-T14]|uniref:hypothetical protein n=1 Tax=unclassified Leifsonia TaxID=2663824 RepID=UPI0035A6DA92